jgi:hypothetical protein
MITGNPDELAKARSQGPKSELEMVGRLPDVSSQNQPVFQIGWQGLQCLMVDLVPHVEVTNRI